MLVYPLNSPGMPANYTYRLSEINQELIVAAYRLSTMADSAITKDDPTVQFVIKNFLDTVLSALNSATVILNDQSKSNQESDIIFFLGLMLAATCTLIFSLAFLVPVINLVKKSKQEVLELFMHRKLEKHIDEQAMQSSIQAARFQGANEENELGVIDRDTREKEI